jgi:hypothetical protein
MAIYGVLYGDVAGGKVSVHASAEIIREEIKNGSGNVIPVSCQSRKLLYIVVCVYI